MEIITEITIKDTQGIKHQFQILIERNENRFEIVKLEPEPKEIATAESFDQAMTEITIYLFFNEIEIN